MVIAVNHGPETARHLLETSRKYGKVAIGEERVCELAGNR
jgi:hypothetical protein